MVQKPEKLDHMSALQSKYQAQYIIGLVLSAKSRVPTGLKQEPPIYPKLILFQKI